MMTCRQIENELSAYVDGELTDAARSEVQAHVAGCERCHRRLDELQRLSDGVAQLPRLEPMPRFVPDLFRRLSAPSRSWVDVVFRPVWLKVPVEAVAVLVVAVGVMFLSEHGRKQQQSVCSPVAPAEPVARLSERRSDEAMSTATAAPAPTAPLARAKPAGAPMLALKMEAADSLRERERVSVVDANPSVAEQRVRSLVARMRGSVVEVKQDDGTPRVMRVRVPTAMVGRFKAQLAQASVAVEGKVEAGAYAETESAKPKEEPMTELEIQITRPPVP